MEETVKKTRTTKSTVKNCLRNEKVTVKFLARKGAFDVDPNSPLAGGLADTSVRSYVVPFRKDGSRLVNPLSNEEKECLERVLGLEEDALSIYKKPCYWSSSTKGAINRVTVGKDGMILDLSDPEDYIRYAILRSNSEKICPSWEEHEKSPKPTYEFCLVNESAEIASVGNKTAAKSKCYKKYFEIENDNDIIRTVLKIIEGRKAAPSTPIENLQDKLQGYFETSPTKAYEAMADEYLYEKVLLEKAVEKNVVTYSRGVYSMREGGMMLCEDYDTNGATYQNAAKYLANIEHQEIKFKIEELIK